MLASAPDNFEVLDAIVEQVSMTVAEAWKQSVNPGLIMCWENPGLIGDRQNKCRGTRVAEHKAQDQQQKTK
jgi:hypothetical protein